MISDWPHKLRQPVTGRRLRLGFVGGGQGGLVGQWHAAGARLSNHWDIVAGALSADAGRAKASGKEWMLEPSRSYSDYREMAKAEASRTDGIDAVAICTPNWTHFDIACAFLDQGIDVICDKPMTTALEDAQKLVEKQSASGVNVFVTYPFAFFPMVRQARHMIDTGAIGKVRQVYVEYVQEWASVPPDPSIKGRAWRMDREKAGPSSAIGDIGTHAYHLLHYASGLNVERLRAEFHVCGAPKDLEDTAYINLRLEGDVPGLMLVSQAAPGQYCGLRFRIWGETGGLSWDQENPELLLHAPLGEAERHIKRGTGGGMVQPAERLAHLPRGHGESLTDAWSNLYAEMAIAIAARRTGRRLPDGLVELPDVSDGALGVAFVQACVDSHTADSAWSYLADYPIQ